jgi:FAD/FMN-containing dehydrogenase
LTDIAVTAIVNAIMSSTSPTRPATLSSTQLQILRGQVSGRVFAPGDDGYDVARQTWSAAHFDQRPAVVVMPSNPADVASAVTFARAHELSIAVQGGGHGHPRPANDALLVNFASMTSVHVTHGTAASDPSSRAGAAGTARVEAGARWRDVIAAAHPYGLAPLNGFAGTVGVSGYTLGGGIGWLVRQYGAAAASLRSAELVTADGRLMQADDRTHADLFWGLRGGGGNFGVVTSFEFDLYPVKEIFGGFVAYPLADGKQVLSAYSDWTKTVPETLTSAVRLVHYPPAPAIPEPLRGASAIVIMACHTGSTAEGQALLKPLQSIATPLFNTFRSMPYAEVGTIASDPPEAPPLFTFGNGGGLRDLSTDVIDAVLRIAGDRAAGIFLVEVRHVAGALARQPEDAMPFTFRSPWFISALAAAPTPDALEGGKRSVAALLQALTSALTGEVLINGVDHAISSPQITRAAYSEKNYRRLVALKDDHDPTNVFRFNHNIPPSTGR